MIFLISLDRELKMVYLCGDALRAPTLHKRGISKRLNGSVLGF